MRRRRAGLFLVGTLVASCAAAQSSNVVLYGRANVGIDNYSATGATAPDANLKARNRIFDSGSRLGFRGFEDLGGGMRAVFQIETGVNIDSGTGNGQNGTVNANANGAFASRDSFVGLEGGFGRVTLGRQSIFWVNGTIIQTGANYVNAEVPFMNGAILGRTVSGMARNSNVILYTTPTFGGFNATLGFSPQNEATQSGAGDVSNTDGKVWGATARWGRGPILLQGDYWVNDAAKGQRNAFVGVSATKFEAAKLLVGWTYRPGGQVSLVAGRNRNDASSGFSVGTFGTPGFQAANISQSWFGVSWEHAFGNLQALAQYGQVRDATGCIGSTAATTCTDTGNTGYLAGVRYVMSKRTSTYVTYNRLTNKANSNNDYIGGGFTSSTLPLANGADPRLIAVGIQHNF